MSKRFEGMMQELMQDLFEVQSDPAPILSLQFDDAAPAAVEAYSVTVASQSKGKKTYTAPSGDFARNVQLLNVALSDLHTEKDDAKRAAIRVFIHAIIDAL